MKLTSSINSEKKILIIGDSCKDVFVYCKCDRLCPEAPVPVLDIVEEVSNWGMAANVRNNIISIKSHCDLVTNFNFELLTKTRYMTKKANHMFIRIDTGGRSNPITPNELAEIDFSSYDAVIISDYNKGFLSVQDIEYISLSHPLAFLDSKKTLGPWANHVKFIKINGCEYKASKDIIEQSTLKDKVIHTLGGNGCEYRGVNYPVESVEVKDLSGAGDSFLAALVVKYLENRNIEESLVAANAAASIVVQKMGVSTINE